MSKSQDSHAVSVLAGPVADWFRDRFPGGPTPGQRAAWPAIEARQNVLLVSPTGTGKTLAAFLAILARLWAEHEAGRLGPGLRCVYVSPLRSLGYDIERNLAVPLEEIRSEAGLKRSPITVGVRTGDTSAYQRRRMQRQPPHLLITTPESLALLLSQPAWNDAWSNVNHVIIDEVHALVPTKRGADLAVSLERLSACASSDPVRIGLSATCRPAEMVARWLVGPERSCQVVEPARGCGEPHLELDVEWLGQGSGPEKWSSVYRNLLRRLARAIDRHRTTLVFANTRAFAERITHDLRRAGGVDPESVAAHHSALDAHRRRAVEAQLKAGKARAVVSSTSLELGVDIGTVDLAVQIGPPGGVARLLQRVGRAGHQVGAVSHGLLLAGTPAELAVAAVTARAAREGQIEALRAPEAPLDVLCQQLIGMACARDCDDDEAFALVRRAGPMFGLVRADFEDCLDFLGGSLGTSAGACDPEPGSGAPRIWRQGGRFGLRSRRVRRWLWRNIGTICSEESVSVVAGGIAVGTIEAAYAERLQVGDRFVLDGRALEFRRLDGSVLLARVAQGDPELPRWSSDRMGLPPALAREVAFFQEQAAARLSNAGQHHLRTWLAEEYGLHADASAALEDLLEAQERISEVPRAGMLLVEEWPHGEGFAYAFHAPLGRCACEPLARAMAARLGQRFGRNITLAVADLGWSIRLEDEGRLSPDDLPGLLEPEGFEAAALEGLERGDLLARRFRHVATTALMVLRNPDGGRKRVGGLFWVSKRLYPLLKARCPEHPLLRETRKEVLDHLLDTSAALDWLRTRPTPRMRVLRSPSPMAAAWIDPALAEHICFEPAGDALKRLHARLMAVAGNARADHAGGTPFHFHMQRPAGRVDQFASSV